MVLFKKLTLGVLFFASVFFVYASFGKDVRNFDNDEPSRSVLQKIKPTPTPFLFQEMTIPGLRNRNYESSFSGLKEFAKEFNYTSYLTSYLSDGLKINALLTKPDGDMPEGGYPGIVFVHGYIPPSSYKTSENYDSYVDFLAKSGLAVFKIDLRGHGDSDGEAGGGYYSGDYVIDTLNAVSALKTLPFINPDRVGLWGHSMAGNVVLRSLAVKPDISAVVIWAGAGYTYADLQEYGIQDSSYRQPSETSERARKRQLLRDTYGEFNKDHLFWRQIPATNYLSDIKSAIGLYHSADDNVVSIEYSRNLTRLLDKTAIPHELNEYPTGGHNLTGATFTKAMNKTIEFYFKHL